MEKEQTLTWKKVWNPQQTEQTFLNFLEFVKAWSSDRLNPRSLRLWEIDRKGCWLPWSALPKLRCNYFVTLVALLCCRNSTGNFVKVDVTGTRIARIVPTNLQFVAKRVVLPESRNSFEEHLKTITFASNTWGWMSFEGTLEEKYLRTITFPSNTWGWGAFGETLEEFKEIINCTGYVSILYIHIG